MNPRNEISRGFWIELDDQQERDLMDLLMEKGYTRDKDGIKNFLIDSTYPKAEENAVPEMEELLATGLAAIGNLIKKKAGL